MTIGNGMAGPLRGVAEMLRDLISEIQDRQAAYPRDTASWERFQELEDMANAALASLPSSPPAAQYDLAKEIAADLEDAGLVNPGRDGIQAMEVIKKRLALASPVQGVQAIPRSEVRSRLNDVAQKYFAGGHSHRAQMLRALADEFDPDGKQTEEKKSALKRESAPQDAAQAGEAEAGRQNPSQEKGNDAQLMSEVEARLYNMRIRIASSIDHGYGNCDCDLCWILKLLPAAPPVAEKTELDQAGRPPRTVGCTANADCIHECPVSEPESRLDEFKTTVIALMDPDLSSEQKKAYIAGRSKELRRWAALGSGKELREQFQGALREAAAKVFAEPIVKAANWPETKERMGLAQLFVLAGMESISPLLAALALPLAPKAALGDTLWQRCLSLVEKCREKTPDKWDFAYELSEICKEYAAPKPTACSCGDSTNEHGCPIHGEFYASNIAAPKVPDCKHERLNKEGICRSCGEDCRGIHS